MSQFLEQQNINLSRLIASLKDFTFRYTDHEYIWLCLESNHLFADFMNVTSPRNSKVPNWSTIIMFALGFWLSGSLVFDFLVVPGMLTSGMMNESGFASAGYMIFGTFNHVELLCAAIILAGCFVYRYGYGLNTQINTQSLVTASILLIIALAYTYILTPQMSSLGMSLDLFSAPQSNPAAMKIMHLAYWGLEAVKLIAATALLRIFYRNSCAIG